MRSLKKRVRPDNIPNERRVARGSTGRIVYLFLLALFSLAVLNYLFGDFVLLGADGIVLRDQNAVSTTYVARVDSVDVKEGQQVKKGDKLMRLESTEILERLAELSLKRAELATKNTDLKIRGETAEHLLPLAERRADETTNLTERFDSMASRGVVTPLRHEEALRANYDASRDRVSLAAQSEVMKNELTALETATSDADKAIEDLKASYDDGMVYALVSGSIGATVPAVGNVYRPGDPILSIYSGPPYVLLYLPRRYLFPIDVGMSVTVTDGKTSATGVVSEILPVTDALPREFQNTFQPQDRNQLAKIKFTSPALFPLHQKVTISRGGSFWHQLWGG